MTERTVTLTYRQARAVAHALVFDRIVVGAGRWPDWEEYPYLDEESWERVMISIEVLGEDLLRAAHAMVDDPDELDRLLQRATFGGDE